MVKDAKRVFGSHEVQFKATYAAFCGKKGAFMKDLQLVIPHPVFRPACGDETVCQAPAAGH